GEAHRRVRHKAHACPLGLREGWKARGIERLDVGGMEDAVHRPFEPYHFGQVGERRGRLEIGHEIGELLSVIVETRALWRVRLDENARRAFEELGAYEAMHGR